MTSKRSWWRSTGRWRTHHFSTCLRSDLPGAVFSATFATSWQAGDDAIRVIAEPFLRHQLRTRAAAITSGYSVDQHSAAADEIQLAVGILRLQDEHLGIVETKTAVKLTVDQESRQLQEGRLSQQREHQLRAEIEKAHLTTLRDEVLNDCRTALAWLILRFPELATATPGQVITAIIDEAKQSYQQAESPLINERQQAISDLVTWLTSDDTDGPQTALKTLDFVLEKFGEDRLRQKLQTFNSQGAEKVSPTPSKG